jgi:hypothetical protein
MARRRKQQSGRRSEEATPSQSAAASPKIDENLIERWQSEEFGDSEATRALKFAAETRREAAPCQPTMTHLSVGYRISSAVSWLMGARLAETVSCVLTITYLL